MYVHKTSWEAEELISAQVRLQSLGNTNSAKTPRGHSELEKKPKTEASRPKGTQKQIPAALLTGSIHNA